MADLEITQTRSLIGQQDGQRRTIRALGLRRVRHTVTQPDRPEIRGMLAKIAHLVEVRYADADAALDLEAGQEPKGPGNPPAGPSVADDEASDRAEAQSEALAEPGSVGSVGDLVDNPPSLRTSDTVHKPKQRGSGAAEEEADEPAAEAADTDAAGDDASA